MHPLQLICTENGLSCLDYQGYEIMPCLGIYFDSPVMVMRALIRNLAQTSAHKHLILNALAESKVHEWGAGYVMYFPGIPFVGQIKERKAA